MKSRILPETEHESPPSGVKPIPRRSSGIIASTSPHDRSAQKTNQVDPMQLLAEMSFQFEANLADSLRTQKKLQEETAKTLESIREAYQNLVLGALAGWAVVQRTPENTPELHPVSAKYKYLMPDHISLMVNKEGLLQIGQEDNFRESAGQPFRPDPSFALMKNESTRVYLPDSETFVKKYIFWGNLGYFGNRKMAEQFKAKPNWDLPQYFGDHF